jgi:hypothetical protein
MRNQLWTLRLQDTIEYLFYAYVVPMIIVAGFICYAAVIWIVVSIAMIGELIVPFVR